MPRLQARLLRYSQTLEMLWGSLGVALGWLWGSLGVALGWLWSAYAVPINRPWGGLGVALGGFAQPPFWFQLSAFSISAFAKVWLCAALFLISAFSFQHFSFCPIVALGWLARPVTNHLRLWMAVPGLSMLEVGSWMFDVRVPFFISRAYPNNSPAALLTHPLPHPVPPTRRPDAAAVPGSCGTLVRGLEPGCRLPPACSCPAHRRAPPL